jgi:hypothetical protein
VEIAEADRDIAQEGVDRKGWDHAEDLSVVNRTNEAGVLRQ